MIRLFILSVRFYIGLGIIWLNRSLLCMGLLGMGLLGMGLLGCESRIDDFTAGKLENLCQLSIPVCQTRVTCLIDEDHFISGDFPGSSAVLLYAEHPKNRLKVKILLSEEVYPGTELLIRLYDVGCVSSVEKKIKEMDIFLLAGEDQILDFEFELNGLGDHLIEIFSDMNAHYQLIVDIQPQFAQE
jgi:hypothetical protein